MKRSFNMSDREVDALWDEIADEATNPIFAPADPEGAAAGVLPARNGPPTVQGAVNKANNDKKPTPTAPAVKQAGTGAVTKNGINRGTDMGKKLAGNNSA